MKRERDEQASQCRVTLHRGAAHCITTQDIDCVEAWQMKQVRRRQEETKMAAKAEGQAALEKLRQIQMVSDPPPLSCTPQKSIEHMKGY